jgi:hypothetical protein
VSVSVSVSVSPGLLSDESEAQPAAAAVAAATTRQARTFRMAKPMSNRFAEVEPLPSLRDLDERW